MKTLTVFDPAMCCSTGVCGTDIDQVLVDFSADVQWLKQRGIQVDRYNLAQQPMSFVQNEKAKAFLEASGAEGLPLLLLDGEMVMAGALSETCRAGPLVRNTAGESRISI
ncbi:Arsenical resistance operon trans-acting repressor ArsD [Hafnia alvei]|uniref:Arsenical resistance operon trans-acting repressor ArsD n=1 Tax=Hafnia alvei TaxID=569 RepID=A0A377TDI3_HAFAL|nr:Arsenical resistance operon trans-acting repressor ArsD [Hafnia alvei]